LYSTLGGHAEGKIRELAILWVLNLSDGKHGILDIAEKSGLKFALIKNAADDLRDHKLLNEISRS
jgi:aminopeptidase-like protein